MSEKARVKYSQFNLHEPVRNRSADFFGKKHVQCLLHHPNLSLFKELLNFVGLRKLDAFHAKNRN